MAQRQNLADIENDPEKIGTRYTVRNPHPGFSTDSNIKNEYGHTEYPKWIKHPVKKQIQTTVSLLGKDQSRINTHETYADGTPIMEDVLVNNKEEEDALMAGKEVKTKGWNK